MRWLLATSCAPTTAKILLAGTPEQHERYLAKIFSGEEIWCQLFSEPDVGSDLANLACRATRDGDEYVINGSKIWSSGAHHSQFGILIARTDPEQVKHGGISMFIVDMKDPAVEVRAIHRSEEHTSELQSQSTSRMPSSA